jgi:hypothetical protein
MRRYSWNRETASASEDGEVAAAAETRRRGKRRILVNSAMVGARVGLLLPTDEKRGESWRRRRLDSDSPAAG